MHLAHTHHNFTGTPSSLMASAKAAMYPSIGHNRQHVTSGMAKKIIALGCKSISSDTGERPLELGIITCGELDEQN
jgi:3-oxoacyl-(acyl-carrier-protein) synthase